MLNGIVIVVSEIRSQNPIQTFARWFGARSILSKAALIFGFFVLIGALSLAVPDEQASRPVVGATTTSTGTGIPSGSASPSAGPTTSGSPSPQASATLGPPARTIAGLTLARVARRFVERGYRCDGPRSTFTEFEWTCSLTDPSVRREVRIVGADPNRIRTVAASLRYEPGTNPRPDRAAAFLKLVAGVKYDDAKPKRAARWVQQTVETGGVIAIGAAQFDLRRADEGRTWALDITGVIRTR